jgi:hypothetical protein
LTDTLLILLVSLNHQNKSHLASSLTNVSHTDEWIANFEQHGKFLDQSWLAKAGELFVLGDIKYMVKLSVPS